MCPRREGLSLVHRARGKTTLLVALVSCALCGLVKGSERSFPPGHSHNGDVFDHGPRQSGYLMGGTGKIHFPVTSKDARAQQFVEQGIGQLHGFWYYEAERSFRQAAAIDPACGIAYWGMSLANQRNPTRSRQFAAQAAGHKAGLSTREQMYIDALTNDTGYKALIEHDPSDLEAKAFEVWRLWHKVESGAGQPADIERGLRLAHEILAVDPMHPIHHAVIHFVDESNNQRRGLESAAKSGEAAPSIGHMWHMPTHIYYPLKRYPEAAWQLEAALRTENARIFRDHLLPDQVQLYAHNNEWLVRTLMHLGRVRDARQIAQQMIDLPRHPLLNVIEPPDQETTADEPKKPKEAHGSSAYYGRERLLQILRRYEYWDDLIEACQTGDIEATHLAGEQAKVHIALGVAYYCKGELAAGDRELQALRQLWDEQATLKRAAVDEAEQMPERSRTAALHAAEKRFGRPLVGIQHGIAELESYRRIVTGFFVSRSLLIGGLAAILASEALALWLLRGRWIQSVLAVLVGVGGAGYLCYGHWALVNMADETTNVDFAFVTRSQLKAGDPAVALQSAREFARSRVNQVRPLANLVEVLYAAGGQDEARAEFQKLRELAGTADLDAPPFARLGPIAREFGWPTDWRLPQEINKTLGDRRPLESMGPRAWKPWLAPEWKLSDAQGHEHSLNDFRGKPLILLFSLGEGCLHCQAQLEAFVRDRSKIEAAGWTVVVISSDNREGVQKSLASYKPAPFPFLMLADPDLKVFQSYRAYDDFERIALHGTFLIDPSGRVRWSDVGSEPFTDLAFLFGEFKRLLARPVPVAAQ
jgi:peroxiredoxin